jgi:hypothetical protein
VIELPHGNPGERKRSRRNAKTNSNRVIASGGPWEAGGAKIKIIRHSELKKEVFSWCTAQSNFRHGKQPSKRGSPWSFSRETQIPLLSPVA